MPNPTADAYRGRFAPSPSGPLHLGSLVAALGSYLDARAHQGRWLVRIEDIDPPREVPGAADTILRQLEAHGLYWDETVRYQSLQSELYQAHLESLAQHQQVYACDCTRKQIKARAPYYTGFCRNRNLTWQDHALRFKNDSPVLTINDVAHGDVSADEAWAREDFILKRRDGLWAYQLAVVSDDRAQRISHIVRGSDLLIPSLWQMSLWQNLNKLESGPALPVLHHLPLVCNQDGRKLSKQNHAPAIDPHQAPINIANALLQLGLSIPNELQKGPVREQLSWAVSQWPTQINTANG